MGTWGGDTSNTSGEAGEWWDTMREGRAGRGSPSAGRVLPWTPDEMSPSRVDKKVPSFNIYVWTGCVPGSRATTMNKTRQGPHPQEASTLGRVHTHTST